MWKSSGFTDCLAKEKMQKVKIMARDYSKKGKIPVVDQGQDLISGWTDREDAAIENLPVIIFGDHTRIFKFIDFPFAIGADGTQIIRPNDNFFPRFFYYYCRSLDIPNRGYSRHYSILKEKQIRYPDMAEQKKISLILKKIEDAISLQRKLIDRTTELKLSTQHLLLVDRKAAKGNWDSKKLCGVCTFTTGKLNSNAAKPDGQYPFFTCSQETAKIDSYAFDQEAVILSGNNAQGIYSAKYFNGKFNAYQRTYIFTVKNCDELSYKYLLYDLSLKLNMLRRMSLGATTKYLTATILNNLDISLPPIKEQIEIAEILSALDKKIDLHRERHEKFEKLFAASLQKLMSGELNLARITQSEQEVTHNV